MAGTEQTREAASRPRLSVGFILARRFTLCAFANFVDVLRLSADEGDRSRPIFCGWRVLSSTMEPITSSSGIAVHPEERLGDPARFDYIVVVGGLIDETENLHPDYVRFLHAAAAAGVPLVGVCTGAFILHRAGLMNGYRCCVSWFHHDDFLQRFEGMKPVSDRIFVVDRDRLTCSGGVSSAHLAAFLVDRHVGQARAQFVARKHGVGVVALHIEILRQTLDHVGKNSSGYQDLRFHQESRKEGRGVRRISGSSGRTAAAGSTPTTAYSQRSLACEYRAARQWL